MNLTLCLQAGIKCIVQAKSKQGYRVTLTQFKNDRFDSQLTHGEKWLADIFAEQLANTNVELDSIKGELHLINSCGNVTVNGQLEFKHHPICARCGETLARHEKIDLSGHFAPVTSVKGSVSRDKISEEEEIELTEDDLNFCFYDNDEITLDPFINDAVALHIPYNYYCRDEEPCQKRHENNLKLAELDPSDPRWGVLKNFKFKDSPEDS